MAVLALNSQSLISTVCAALDFEKLVKARFDMFHSRELFRLSYNAFGPLGQRTKHWSYNFGLNFGLNDSTPVAVCGYNPTQEPSVCQPTPAISGIRV